jgi:hypothetical protein
MGQAEEVGYRVLAAGAGMIGIGLLLTLTVVLIYLGVPLMVLGAAVVLGGMSWMFAINRRMTLEVLCPECQKRTRVLAGVTAFRCDDCSHEIAVEAAAAGGPGEVVTERVPPETGAGASTP